MTKNNNIQTEIYYYYVCTTLFCRYNCGGGGDYPSNFAIKFSEIKLQTIIGTTKNYNSYKKHVAPTTPLRVWRFANRFQL